MEGERGSSLCETVPATMEVSQSIYRSVPGLIPHMYHRMYVAAVSPIQEDREVPFKIPKPSIFAGRRRGNTHPRARSATPMIPPRTSLVSNAAATQSPSGR